jgi:type III restriction enzyme
MTYNPYVNSISGRLSLRKPQRDSLAILSRITEVVPPLGSIELSEALSIIRAEYPHVEDFERTFPSLCFALATGVGKTRLMGAFITYLHLAHGIRNFFVLAPNLTIYNKLIADFTANTPKYVFRGIAEFAVNAPLVITGDTYEGLTNTLLDAENSCRINVFNISKINSEVKGGKAPKIRKLSEFIGKSYFDYLASLPDLVLLMDESHRYRATAGIRAINELNPVLGLELTATPQVETPKGPVRFKNIIYDYPLAAAMEDGFVKEPAAATKENFSTTGMTPSAIEEVKLVDGIALHERVKAELEAYAINNVVKKVKPFVLIIARDTSHATQLLTRIQSDDFAEGFYKDKVIQVDSSTKEDEVIDRLLRVEDVDEPTEIVIHVNMLKEGWDVTNLYTIIPLRAASARTLVEQSIGRGLRLPYGRKTGVPIVDTLNIIAHDRFQEIIDEARSGDSPINIKAITIGASEEAGKVRTVISSPNITLALNSTEKNKDLTHDVFSVEEIPVARAVYEAIQRLAAQPDLVPNSQALDKIIIRKKIEEEVTANLLPEQGKLSFDDNESKRNVGAIVAKVAALIQQQTIDIPQIQVVPKGAVSLKFDDFSLDLTPFSNFQPVSETMVIQALRTAEQQKLKLNDDQTNSAHSPEDEIVDVLSAFNDVSYDEHAELLYSLASQVTKHIGSYLPADEIGPLVRTAAKTIGNSIYNQMQRHIHELTNDGYEVKISRAYTPLKMSAYTSFVNEEVVDYKRSPKQASEIKKYVFGGFSRCLHDVTKFHSNPERVLSIILDRDSLKWLRPATAQFPITYLHNGVYSSYDPDFVAETGEEIIMIEVKDNTKLDDVEVQAKARAATKYCKHASDFNLANGGKAWKYLLIPDVEILENKTLQGLINQYTKHDE